MKVPAGYALKLVGPNGEVDDIPIIGRELNLLGTAIDIAVRIQSVVRTDLLTGSQEQQKDNTENGSTVDRS